MKKLLIFSGTSEEYELIAALKPYSVAITLSVASEYGRDMAKGLDESVKIIAGRLNAGEMKNLISAEGFFAVVDATHPYAQEVTKNIRSGGAGNTRRVFSAYTAGKATSTAQSSCLP
jgi:precorrin-6x reductase